MFPLSPFWMESNDSFLTFFSRVFEMMRGDDDPERELRNEFILQQLLTVAGVLDLSDEVGR